MGLRARPVLVVLSPLSLALLWCDERLSRLLTVTPRSESSDRLPPPLTAFLRCSGELADAFDATELECEWDRGGEGEGAGALPFPRLEGESVKRGSQE